MLRLNSSVASKLGDLGSLRAPRDVVATQWKPQISMGVHPRLNMSSTVRIMIYIDVDTRTEIAHFTATIGVGKADRGAVLLR